MSANLEMIEKVAKGLAHLKNHVVFVGGAVAELYADDPAASDIRPTKDVDCVVEISSRKDYYSLEKELREIGFTNDQSKAAPVCRWIYDDVIVDIMPTEEKILGFSNQWYKSGIVNKQIKSLNDGNDIYVFPVEYYLASKFEAMIGRGGSDLRTNHDFEDIIYLMDNTSGLNDIISNSADNDLRKDLAIYCQNLITNKNINESIIAVLPYGMEERLDIIKDIIEKIAMNK